MTTSYFSVRSPLVLLAVLGLVSCQSTTPPDRFVMADRDGNGFLNADEVSDFYVGGVFDARDTNKDGKITKAEWNPEMEAAESREFARHDANGDGVVTRDEAMAWARKGGTYAAVVKEADTNKDGLVSRDEAMAYFASKE